MSGRLEGKVAFVTGAARGQGRSHAQRLAQEGADVIAVDICDQVASVPYKMATPADLEETAELVRAAGRRVYAAAADVRNYDQLAGALDRGVGELGRLDIACANAGIASLGPAETLSEEQWTDLIDINLSGVWRTAKAAIPHLRAAGGGSIVLTSSTQGLSANRNIAHYVASKHGVIGLMRALSLELASQWIRVNAVLPTQVDTPMIQYDNVYKFFRPDLEHPTKADFAEASTSSNALPIPWVDPVDISNAVVFLCSDEARYITGVALPVDAGNLLK